MRMFLARLELNSFSLSYAQRNLILPQPALCMWILSSAGVLIPVGSFLLSPLTCGREQTELSATKAVVNCSSSSYEYDVLQILSNVLGCHSSANVRRECNSRH